MKKDVRKIAVDYILQNTSEANIKKAVSGFDIQSIIEPHKEWLLRNIFFGDGVKYTAGLYEIFEEFISWQDLKSSKTIISNLKDLNRKVGLDKNNEFYHAEIVDQEKQLKPYASRLKKLLTYHNKINQK